MVPGVMAVLVLWEWEKPGVKVEDIGSPVAASVDGTRGKRIWFVRVKETTFIKGWSGRYWNFQQQQLQQQE